MKRTNKPIDERLVAYEKLKKTDLLFLLNKISLMTAALSCISLNDNSEFQTSMFANALLYSSQLNEYISRAIQLALI